MTKKVLFIIMPRDFQDEEFIIPYEKIIASGYSVEVAGLTQTAAVGSHGYTIAPDLLLEDITQADIQDYDALIIPGGAGSVDYLWNNVKVQNIIHLFHHAHKMVATICYACITSAQAGILTGKKATVYPTNETKKIFKHHGVTYQNAGCVVLENGKIITAQGPHYADQFAEQIIKHL